MPGLPGHAGQAQPARAGRSGLSGAALTLIHTGQAPTRSALTAALGVTRATAGAVTAELRDLGLIQVGTGTRAGTQGRPSHRLAIDTGGPVALAGLGGRIVARTSRQGPVPGDPARALAPLAEAGAVLLRRSGRACAGVGLVVPSAVS